MSEASDKPFEPPFPEDEQSSFLTALEMEMGQLRSEQHHPVIDAFVGVHATALDLGDGVYDRLTHQFVVSVSAVSDPEYPFEHQRVVLQPKQQKDDEEGVPEVTFEGEAVKGMVLRFAVDTADRVVSVVPGMNNVVMLTITRPNDEIREYVLTLTDWSDVSVDRELFIRGGVLLGGSHPSPELFKTEEMLATLSKFEPDLQGSVQ